MTESRSGSKVMEAVVRLQTIDTQHKARSESIIKWAVAAARSLKEAFDEYVGQEIAEMKETLLLLASVQQEVEEERETLRQLEIQYLRLNDDLNDIIDAANRHRIKRIDFTKPQRPSQPYPPQPAKLAARPVEAELEELDILTIIESFGIVGDVEDLRQRIDRAARNYRRSISDIEGVVNEILRKQGLGGASS